MLTKKISKNIIFQLRYYFFTFPHTIHSTPFHTEEL